MLYTIFNGAMPTTAAQVPVTTGTTTAKTLLQIKPFNIVKVVEWGISFDGFVAALPIRCELLDTGTVFATVTPSADADIAKMESGEQSAASVAGLTLATNGTGYTSTAESTPTAVKMFDCQFVAPTNQYIKQFPLGREPRIIVGNCCRIRVTANTAVLAYAYMVLDF